MFRYEMGRLIQWKSSQKRKPMILFGARQVGKTWLMKKFGEDHFDKVAYINFDSNIRMDALFADDYHIDRII